MRSALKSSDSNHWIFGLLELIFGICIYRNVWIFGFLELDPKFGFLDFWKFGFFGFLEVLNVWMFGFLEFWNLLTTTTSATTSTTTTTITIGCDLSRLSRPNP